MRRSGHEGAHGVLGALQRSDADQELVRGDAREIILEVPRRHGGIHVALLHLQRQSAPRSG